MRRLFLCMVVVVSVLAGCSSDGLGGITVVTSGRHDAGPVRFLGDVVVLGGSLRLDEGSTVDGSVHVLGGDLVVAGDIAGDITAIGGRLQLEPAAVIRGDVSVSAGGVLDMADGASVQGSLNEGLAVGFDVDPGVSDPVSFLLRSLVLAVAIGAVRQLAPRRTRMVGAWVGDLPAASIAYGFLLGLVGVSLAVFMAFTIILAPVALILLIALGLAVLLGLAGIGAEIERRIAPSQRRWRTGLGSIICAATLSVAPLVPVVGLLATIVLITAALGAVGFSLQRGDARRRLPSVVDD